MNKRVSLWFVGIMVFYFSGCSVSDSVLEKKFKANRSKFDKLLGLVDSCLGDNAERFVWVDKALLSAKPCTDLMQSIGIRGLYKNKKDASVQLYLRHPSSNSVKGYFYSENELSPLLDSLDALAGNRDKAPLYEMVYKSLGHNWYLYYENLNG